MHPEGSSLNGLFRYFYGELHQLAHGCSPLRNIFLDCHAEKLQLRNNISIHLVLSDAPNGDAKEYLPSDTNECLNTYDAVNKRLSFDIVLNSTRNLGSNEKCHTHTSLRNERTRTIEI